MGKAAVVQLNSSDDVAANLARCFTLVAQAQAAGAQLVLLPENFAFLGRDETAKFAVAEPWGERAPIQVWLAETARHFGVTLVAGSLPIISDSGKTTATQAVVNAMGEVVARYDKIHLFDVQLPDGTDYRESRAINPGASVVTAASAIGRLGLSICYDVRFAELYQQLVQAGAEVMLVPAAFTAPTGAAHWQSLLRARAIENQCYVLAANQVGEHVNGRASYGHSCIIDPWGKELAVITEGEGIACADIDLAYLHELRASFPVAKHRRL